MLHRNVEEAVGSIGCLFRIGKHTPSNQKLRKNKIGRGANRPSFMLDKKFHIQSKKKET
jgi:hypothetical protein